MKKKQKVTVAAISISLFFLITQFSLCHGLDVLCFNLTDAVPIPQPTIPDIINILNNSCSL